MIVLLSASDRRLVGLKQWPFSDIDDCSGSCTGDYLAPVLVRLTKVFTEAYKR